jgi:hypothetical protein
MFSLSDLRTERILVPYAVWTVVYTSMKLVKSHIIGQKLAIDPLGLVFFGGSAVQLYFLPLLLLMQGMALIVILLKRNPLPWRMIGLVFFPVALLGYLGMAGQYYGFSDFLFRGVGFVSLAFLLRYAQGKMKWRQFNSVFCWAILPLAVSTVYLGYPLNYLGKMEGPLVGYCIAGIALNTRFTSDNALLRKLLTCSFGIFLVHFGFLEFYEFITSRYGISLTPYSLPTKILLALLICACCVLFITITRLNPISAYLLLGESMGKRAQPKSAAPGT